LACGGVGAAGVSTLTSGVDAGGSGCSTGGGTLAEAAASCDEADDAGTAVVSTGRGFGAGNNVGVGVATDGDADLDFDLDFDSDFDVDMGMLNVVFIVITNRRFASS
jgi:hypothetical protein